MLVGAVSAEGAEAVGAFSDKATRALSFLLDF